MTTNPTGEKTPHSLLRGVVYLLLVAFLAACGGGGGGGGGTTTTPLNVEITVQPSDQTVLDGGLATFAVTANNATSYQWQRREGASWANIVGATTQAHTTTGSPAAHAMQFRVMVSGEAGTVASAAASLFVTAAAVGPQVLAQPSNLTVVEGEDARFSVTASGTSLRFLWQSSPDGQSWTDLNASGPMLLLTARTVSDSGKRFRAVISNDIGTVLSDQALLTVTPFPGSPVFLTMPQSVSVAAGQSAFFTAAAAGQPVVSITWQSSVDGATWTNVAGVSGPIYTTGPATTGDNGKWYRALATNPSGTATSGTARLTVTTTTAAPSFTANPQDQTIVAGQTVTFLAAAAGSPTPVLQWQVSEDGGATWLNINGATASHYSLANVPWTATGTRYRVVATSSAGSASSTAALLTVQPTAPVITQQPQDVNVTAPAAANFTVAATAQPTPSYQWQVSVDGGASWSNIAGANASSYSIASTDAARDAGRRFRAVVSNAVGTINSTAVGLTARMGRLCSLAASAGWCWAHPLPQGNFLNGVASPTRSEQIAVGNAGTLLRTSDTGANWAVVPSGTTRDLRGVAFSTTTTGTTVGDAGTILRTTDVGRSWSPVSSGTSQDLYRVAFSATVGLAVGTGGTVLRSSDAGASWQAVSGATVQDLYAITFVNATTVVAAGANGVLTRSVDAGQSWSVVNTGSGSPLYGIAFSSPTHGVAFGDGGFVRTTDGGQTWGPLQGSGFFSARRVAFRDANSGYAVGGDRVLVTTDGGASWAATLNTYESSSGLGDIVLSDANNGVMVGGGGRIFQITDGVNFTEYGTRSTVQALNAVANAGASAVLAVGPSNDILRSTDSGQTWSRVPNPAGVPLYGLAMFDNTVGLAGGQRTILRTADGGLTWSSTFTMTHAALGMAVAPSAPVALAVGENDSVWRSADQGLTWQQVRGASFFSSYVLLGVAFASNNTAVAVGQYAGFPYRHMTRSTDGGQTWSPVNAPVFEPLYAVAFANATTGVAVGRAGTIVRTTDGGANWTSVSSGTSYSLDAVSFASAAVGYASGSGGVTLVTADGGQTWTPQFSGANLSLNGIAASSNGKAVMVGNNGAILFTTTGGQ
jgi:photosystem II stability/assembly factor-like uncharacterized protein